jgi:hypothetical protein
MIKLADSRDAAARSLLYSALIAEACASAPRSRPAGPAKPSRTNPS